MILSVNETNIFIVYRWCKTQDRLDLKTHVIMLFSYDFVFNLTAFHIYPYKYIWNYEHKYTLVNY
jgi:hypothetical protein